VDFSPQAGKSPGTTCSTLKDHINTELLAFFKQSKEAAA
jgi:hypothetical protein